MKSMNGFSLIELLLGISVFSALLIFVGLFSQSVFGVFSRMNETKSVTDTISLVRIALSSSDQCTLNFVNIPVSSTLNQASDISSISVFDLKTKEPTSLLAQVGKNISGVMVDTMQLVPLHLVETGLVYGELRMNFSLSGAIVTLPQHALPIMVRVTQGKVSNCWLKNDSATVDANQTCGEASALGLNVYNKDAGGCSLASGKWFVGTVNSATCPDGTFLSPYANADSNCDFVTPDSFVDSSTALELKYSDGTKNTLTRAPALKTLNFGTSTCTCDWATDINPVDLSTFHCKILCLAP